MPDINTNITPPRVPLTDSRTGLISREWYMFFLSLFTKVGGSTISLDDMQLVPPQQENATANDMAYLAPGASDALAQMQADINTMKLMLSPPPLAPTPVNELAYMAPSDCDAMAQMQSDLDAMKLAPRPLEIHPIPYGSFFDTSSQTGSISSPTPIAFNSTDISSGVYLGATTSRMYVTDAGVYNVQFSLQMQNSTATEGDVNVWLRINGTDVIGSNGLVYVPGKHAGADGHIITGWNFYLSLAATDYVELVWLPSAATITIEAYAAQVGPPAVPSTYSAVLTAFKVNIISG